MRMVYGLRIKLILALLISILVVGVVSAQIIGGEIMADGNFNPSWQNVFVYDVSDVNDYVEVLVSPDGYRYSFVNSRVGGGIIFGSDVIIRAEVLDFLNGFMAGPVDMSLSEENDIYYACEDCDIFSRMEFREVVQVREPTQELYISGDGSFDLSVNVYDGCDAYFVREFTVNGSQFTEKDQFCWDGCDYVVDSLELTVDSGFGLNEFEIMTDCHVGKRFKGGSRGLFPNNDMKNVSFEKRLMFDGDLLMVEFYGVKTDGDFPITDFIPDEYEVFNVSGDGVVYDEDGYYAIEWSDAPMEFNFTYEIKPKSKLDSCDFGVGGHRLTVDGLQLTVIDLKVNDFWSVCNFSDEVSVYVVESVEFSREMGKKIKNKEGILVSLQGEVFCNDTVDGERCAVGGVHFREYVDVSFEIGSISDGGFVEISSSGYNVIVWDINGSSFDFGYNVMPTVAGEFSFMSELGGERMDEYNISVYNFVPPIRRSRGGGSGGYVFRPNNFSLVDRAHPLIARGGNMTVAVYSNNFTSRGALELFGIKFVNRIYNRSLKFFDAYSVESNLGNNSGRFVFEYKVDKKVLSDKNYRELEFYGVDNRGRRNRLTGMSVVEDGGVLNYKFDSEELFREITIFGVKEKVNLVDNIIQWIFNFRIRFLEKENIGGALFDMERRVV